MQDEAILHDNLKIMLDGMNITDRALTVILFTFSCGCDISSLPHRVTKFSVFCKNIALIYIVHANSDSLTINAHHKRMSIIQIYAREM